MKKKILSNPVFYFSSLLLILLIGVTAIFPESTNSWLSQIQVGLVDHASWLYILTVAAIFLFVIYLGLSRFGDIRLGPDHSQPRFSYVSWFAMLFSAGMGIGIMFFGVAEPVMHYLNPPTGDAQTIESAKEAMSITFFHWGLHAWSVYALVGLILSYFSYRHSLPLTLRSALFPLIGRKIWGPIGHTFDIFAIIGTIFGVAASLGYGVIQISSGLETVFGIENTTTLQLFLIVAVTIIATASAVSGVDKGIKILSEVNLLMAVLLLSLVLILGPTDHLLKAFLQNTGNYLSSVVHKTFNLYAYDHSSWLGGWTLMYWAWWLAWSPFVGMFIAKISYGRTVREFIFCIMLIPSFFNFLWMTVFGNSALDIIINSGDMTLATAVKNDVASSLFSFLSHFPFSSVLSVVGIFMVLVFFVTSADSGALVVNLLASGGKDKNPTWQKVYWSFLIGVVAMVVFIAGGLEALQTATILSALPFALILLCAAVGLKKSLELDYLKRQAIGGNLSSSPNIEQGNWKTRVRSIVNTPKAQHIKDFMESSVISSLTSVASEMHKQGLDAEVRSLNERNQITLHIDHGKEIDFIYQVRIREFEPPSFTLSEQKENKTYYRAEVFLKEGGQNYDLMGYTNDQIIADVIDQYEKHLHFLSLVRQT